MGCRGCNVMESYKIIREMQEPFPFLAQLSICGSITGVICLLGGILLLFFFGSYINEEDAIKRIPTWLGIIATGSGIMFIFISSTVTILLCKLYRQAQANQPGGPTDVVSQDPKPDIVINDGEGDQPEERQSLTRSAEKLDTKY